MWIMWTTHRQLHEWDNLRATSYKTIIDKENQLRSCIFLRSKADFGSFRVSDDAEKHWYVFYFHLTLS